MRIPRTLPDGVRVIDGFPIPAGASGDGQGTGDGQGDGQGGDGTGEADGETGTGDGSSETGTGDGDGETGGDGDDGETVEIDGKAVVLPADHPLVATMRSERERRKALERELADERRTNETDVQAREREIREQAQAPVIKALRTSTIKDAARDAGFLYPEDVANLLTPEERDGIEVDLEAETPGADRAEADRLVKALAKRRPGLIQTAGDGDDDGQGAGGSDHQAGSSRSGGSTSSDPNATLRGLFRQKLGTPSR